MKIDVNQWKIAIGDKYDIFVENGLSHNAATEIFKILSVIDLYDAGGSIPVMKIKKKWSWWGAKYDLLKPDGSVFNYRSVSVWRITYQCQVGNDLYDIYGHRGRKHSVFKNGVQIAWWDKKAVTWFDGDNYSITADDNADKELLICFCLLMDNYASKDKDKSTVNISLGNLGIGARKFDNNWQPRYK
jgi:uncharacterized protein YxjI